MTNLFIAYDLMSFGKNYEGVRDAIKSLGSWYQFQFVKRRRTVDQDRRRRVDHPLGCGVAAPRLEARSEA